MFDLDYTLPVNIVPEAIVTGVDDDRAHSDSQRHEALRNSSIPHLSG